MNKNRGDSMHQALYRLYRPKTFDEILGQDAVVSVLKEQVRTGAIGHAYLFSGMRGTGKTSCAKVFARALNCLTPQTGNPCNECAHCQKILNEATIDIIEMDAASNRRIDDIRELRERVIYLPQDLKYKVYIIDEAHMITNEGFNALLKTLEEPPSHLVFILATTEPEKIPRTILSRVQRFHFAALSEDVIAKHVSDVLQREKKTFDEEVPKKIALRSGGAMRDALTSLDQLMHLKHIRIEDVDRVMGSSREEGIRNLLQAIAKKNSVAASETLATLDGNPEVLLADLTYGARRILREKIGAIVATTPWIDEVSVDFTLTMLKIFLETKEKMRFSDDGHLLVELAVYEAIYETHPIALERRVSRLEEMIGEGSVLNSAQCKKTSRQTRKYFAPAMDATTEDRKEKRETIKEEEKVEKIAACATDPTQEKNDSKDEADEPIAHMYTDNIAEVTEELITHPIEDEELTLEDTRPLEKEQEKSTQKLESMPIEVEDEAFDFQKLVAHISAKDPAMGSLLSFGEFVQKKDGLVTVLFSKKHAFQRDYLAHPDRLLQLEKLSKAYGENVQFLLTLEEKDTRSEEVRAFFGDLLERGEKK